MASAAQRSWELENNITLTDPHRDALYTYPPSATTTYNNTTTPAPWKRDPSHFQKIRISAVALLKMVMHARSGGLIEVMGLMLGYISSDTFIVTDSLRLPVEGTETRVNAQDEANEYMVNFLSRSREQGRMENAVGWYHSHPGYGCWLSGIDVNTQETQQMFQDPFVAVVVDPERTMSAGKVEIGAFRTYPKDYKKPPAAAAAVGREGGGAGGAGEMQTAVPLAKSEDFGAHADRYYSLEVSHFKSSLDTQILEALWNKYWVQTLSSSPLFTNRTYGNAQIADLAQKIKVVNGTVHENTRLPSNFGRQDKATDKQLEKMVRAGNKIVAEERGGLLAQEIKEKVFNPAGSVKKEDQTMEEATA